MKNTGNFSSRPGRFSAAALLLLATAWAAAPLRAAVPAAFNYQGKLSGPNGTPITNVAPGLPIIFRIYDGGGLLLTTYTPSSNVPVVNGVFNVMVGDLLAGNVIGSSLDLALSGTGDRFLEVVVNGTPLSPRERLLAAPYAMILADGSVGPSQLAPGAVSDAAISGVSWTKVTGVPAGFADGVDSGNMSLSKDGSFVVSASTMDFLPPFTAVNTGGAARIGVDPSSVTLMGNAFNTGNQLLRLTGGVVPFALLGSTSALRTGLGAASSGVQVLPGTALSGGGTLTGDVTLGLDQSGMIGCDTNPGSGKVYWDGFRLACGNDNGGAGGTVTGSGAAARLAKWTGGAGTSSLGNSSITDNGSSVSVAGAMSVTGSATAPGFIGAGGALTGVDGDTLQGNDSTAFALMGHTHPASSITSGLLSPAQGGTGLGTLAAASYVRASGPAAYDLRTYPQVLSDAGAAAAGHVHDLSGAEIIGVLSGAKGGTGLTSLPADNVLVAGFSGGLAAGGAMGAGQVLVGRSGLPPQVKGLIGTPNQVTVTDGASVTLSLPQDLGTASNVSFHDVNAAGAVSGTWAGSPIGVAFGGTGHDLLTPLTNHGILLGAGSSPVNAMGAGTVGQVLLSNGTLDPVWSLISNTHLAAGAYTNVTGVGTVAAGAWQATPVGAAYGGTGQSAVASGDMLYGTAPNVWGRLPAGSSGQVLTWNGGAPAWMAAPPPGGTVTSVSTGTGITAAPGLSPITNSGALRLDVDVTGGGCNQTSAGKVYWNGSRLICDTDQSGAAGAITGTGTSGQFARWTGLSTVAGSILSQSASVDVAGAMSVTGGGLALTGGGRFSGTAGTSGSGATWDGTAIPMNRGGVGADLSGAASGGVIYSGAAALAGSAAGTSGQLLQANGAAAPSWVSMSGDAAISGTGQITIQPDAVALGADTTGNYVAGINAGVGISTSGAGGENATVTITNTGDTNPNDDFVNGGNSFLANATIGTNDNFRLELFYAGNPFIVVSTRGWVGTGAAVDAPTDPQAGFHIQSGYLIPIAVGRTDAAGNVNTGFRFLENGTVRADMHYEPAARVFKYQSNGIDAITFTHSSGKIGIGGAPPTGSETLRVYGDARVSGGGRLRSTAWVNAGTADMLAVAYGMVASGGGISLAGSGNWSVSRLSTGVYRITMSDGSNIGPTSGAMTVMTPVGSSAGIAMRDTAAATTLTVRIFNTGGGVKDQAFSFVIYRP